MFFSILFFIFFLNNKVYSNEPIKIKADTLKSNKKNYSIKAEGRVEFTKGNYKITSEEIFYDKLNGKIYLKSKVKMIDTVDNKIFAENGEIDDDMQNGIFNEAGIIMNNGTSILSPIIRKEKDNIFKTERALYCFCKDDKLNIDLPYEEIKKETEKSNKQIFTVYSIRSTIDKENKKIYFKHAFIKLFGIPIFYIPYISTSADFREKISGFTNPEIFSHSDYGIALSIGYNFHFENNFRYLIKPVFFRMGNVVLNNNLYFSDNKTRFDLKSTFIFDNNASKNIKNINNITEEKEGTYKQNRYYLSMIFNRRENKNLFFMSNINILSDNYVKRDYERSFSNFANSNFFVSKSFRDNSFLNFHILNIKEILENNNKKKLDNPDLVSNLSYYENFFLYSNEKNKSLILKSNYTFINLFDIERNKYDKLSLNYSLDYSLILNDLSFLEINTNLTSDFYLNNFGKKEEFVPTEERIIPEISVKYEKSIYFSNFSIKPKIEYYYSTNFNRDINYYDNDSKESLISINNIFSNNRYSGNDIREFGNRLNYGINFAYNSRNNILVNALIAQGYRDTIDKKYVIKNFENNLSDILTSFNIKAQNFYFDYLSLIDNKNYEIKQNEFIFSYIGEKHNFSGGYLFERGDKKDIKNKRQLNFETKLSVSKKLKIKVNTNYDLENSKLTFIENGLIFEENCLRVQFSLKKYNYLDYQNNNNWAFNFSFRIINN